MTHSPHPLPDGSALVLDPEPLLAAVPGLLGFVPERSLVLMAFDDGNALTATVRIDLTLTADGGPSPALRAQLADLGVIVAGYGVSGMVAVIVDDRVWAAAIDPLPLFGLVDRLFAEAGGLSAGVVLAGFVTGAPWRLHWQPRPRHGELIPPAPFLGDLAPRGVLTDPMLTPVALKRAVYGGHGVLARRSAEAFAPLPHCDDDVCHGREPQAPPAPAGPEDAARVRRVLARIRFAGDTPLSCDDADGLAEALSAVHARDILLALAVTELREDAERLWCRLARGLPGRAGAAAATLFGHSRYLAGEGAFAAVAIGHALNLDPDYNLARQLNTALIHGMRPSRLAEVMTYSFRLAEDLGVVLPPQIRGPVA
ncbi:MAG: DUF4192 domain-containing protein [Gordonia sp. (in: high G+C Gram-positive bacteria)]|uniref:DUF4192 domain-containing protein n=1 Tax=Gordonia sp. (in: high G+C Gram-positive bacteria) TaxID=84139 RepID=UPI0039E68B94